MPSTSEYEEPIRRHLARMDLSASHGEENHLDRVLTFALALQSRYGGDVDVICAAVLLHDLGRSDPSLHGRASADLSVQRARDVLNLIGFPEAKVATTLQAIAEHDQPVVRPTTLEGRILKDADFLAGMGAMGVARSALWTGESGGSLADFLDRLLRKMPARIASLEFPESRRHAAAEYVFVSLFAAKVQEPPALEPSPEMPYVVFEGISGTGKSTQVGLLAARLSRLGADPLVVREPTPWFRQLKGSLPAGASSETEFALLFADRVINLATLIRDALATKRPVISDRSYVSSAVYQAGDGGPSPEAVAFLHSLMPQPTSLILLDVEPETALARVDERIRAGHGSRGAHEILDRFIIHRERFLSLKRVFPLMHVLNAQVPPDVLHEQVWQAVVRDAPGLAAIM